MAKFLGIDTGGTFTDFILFDDESQSIRIHKVLSTPQAPERAILQGMADLALRPDLTAGIKLSLVHGSTVATNAVLEGKGVRTAYITNKGLADVLVIGRQAREALYDLTPIKKPPLIEAALCLEVNSRLSADGEHLQQLTEPDLLALGEQLQALAPEAVAINLLFSFLDDSEELKIEKAIPDNIFVSRSSDVLPEYKEFERGMSTTLNAMVGPLMQGYLHRLEAQLMAHNNQNLALSIMQSSGGTTSVQQAGCYPVNLLLSGPAGGLKGAQYVAAASGEQQLLTLDMGGTSTDVSIIDKTIGFSHDAKIGGYPVAVPMVDMHTIGAGGGSIAQLDAGGMLLVGPQSAGADPGPACYGRGGQWATVTDANVVLGRLLPQSFLGGHMALDKAAAMTAVNAIAKPLGLSVEQAAQGIIDVVNDHMVGALRVMSVERGEDPKDFILVSFGGAGGLHVCALADELEMTKALVPVNAGVLSALGMLVAEASRERSRTINQRLKNCDAQTIETLFDELVAQTTAELSRPSAPFTEQANSGQTGSIETKLTVDVRYVGQSHALNLPWRGLHKVEQAFQQKHKDSYGHQLAIDIELVNIRVRAIEQTQSFVLPGWHKFELNEPESEKTKLTMMPGIEQAVAVIKRTDLTVAQEIVGPALIIETSSTTWLANGWYATVDKVGNLLLFKKTVTNGS